MSYTIDAGIWSSVFAVPTVIVDEHIKMCSPLSLKILLLLLRHPGTPADVAWLSQTLCRSAEDVADALSYWVSAGLLRSVGEPAQTSAPPQTTSAQPASSAPLPVPASAAVQNSRTEHTTPEGQKVIKIASRRRLGLEEIAELAKTDSAVAQLLSEAQEIFGAPLTPVETEGLVSLYSYYGMQPDTALMLLQYCVSQDKKSMHYIEKIAGAWMEKGLRSHEQIEQEIQRLTRNSENEKKVITAFGLYGRGLTPRERGLVDKWFSLGLDDRLITLACERAAENTGKVSFSYADKILSSWKERGVVTLQQAAQDIKTPPGAPRKQNRSAKTGGDSSIDMDKLHDLLHQPFRN